MKYLITTLGPLAADQVGMILPHEHVFVDLRTWDEPGYAEADPADVIALMAPELARAQEAGVSALVECSPIGVGRRADILKAVSDATGFPLVAPTGIYREPWIPPWAHAAGEDSLYAWMRDELSMAIVGGLEDPTRRDRAAPHAGVGSAEGGVQAGFIKLSAGDDGLSPTEAKILRAAARAAVETGATIGSHTIRGRVVRDQLDILEDVGCPPGQFIWIHAHVEPEVALNLEMARRGVWIEYDGIGGDDEEDGPSGDEDALRRVLLMLEAGFSDQVLLSQDRGWYDPGQPGGGKPRPLTFLSERFLPRLRQAGLSEGGIKQLTCDNPFRAFAR